MVDLYIVQFTGDRDWTDRVPVVRLIKLLTSQHGTKSMLFIAGGAPGLDTIVYEEGKKHNVHVAVIEALWETRQRAAGMQRNVIMSQIQAHECFAFHKTIYKSKGTKGMINICVKQGMKTHLYNGKVMRPVTEPIPKD